MLILITRNTMKNGDYVMDGRFDFINGDLGYVIQRAPNVMDDIGQSYMDYNPMVEYQINNENNIEINVWERGAGLTKACGTAACATVVASHTKGLTKRKVAIKFKEGVLDLEINENNNIFMSGPVSEIKKITLEI